ncbi:MAG: DUF4124 domain-containing protein [Rhodocyclales bacterium]|nr:DUF4124 domain-containing protein [Rhodocyclales bacterium]
MKRMLLLLALTVASLCAHAQVYRWVDDKGKVHYGDRPLGKENSKVRGLIDPNAVADALPKPGMKADELRATYGEPERVRTVSTRNGETEVWAYRKSKRVKRDFVAKIEAGEVVEVVTETAAQPAVATNTTGAASAAADSDYRYRQAMAQREAEQTEQQCAGLRESVERIENQERRGGSGATMDSLRAQKRRDSERLSAHGC